MAYFIDGIRRYVITFMGLYARFSFSLVTQSHAYLAAREFFVLAVEVLPYQLKSALTDNGSEFLQHCGEELGRLYKNHWHTYPRSPRANANVERFNRTIQE